MLFDMPTFVVQRRVNQPLADVQRGLADRTALVPTGMLDLEPDGFLCMPEPLSPVRPYSSRQPVPTWCGTAHLLTPRHRRVATIELEVSMWSDDATGLTIRPVAQHPERWGAWRLRRYFALAHRAADETAGLVARRALLAVAAYRDERARTDPERVEPAFSTR